jgi:oxaloacetate decarboxylase gamma subunit
MTIIEMLGQSGILSILGMGVVFGFLVIMIICVSLSGKLIHALGLDKDVLPSAPAATAAPAAAAVTTINEAEIAAISAAVSEYRKINK